MRLRLLVTVGVALGLVATRCAAAERQRFKSEEAAAQVCEAGNVVWFNPHSRFYFEKDSRFYGHSSRNAGGGFTCRAIAMKWGFRVNRHD